MNDTPASDPSGSTPPDLFLSYAREDRAAAQQLAHALGEEGFSVWWDREIRGGSDFTEEIAAKLHAARRVIVLWSPKAVTSSFVRDESARARDARKLLPVRIEAVDLPLGFGQLQTLDLIDWDGEREAMEFRAVVNEVRHAFGQKVPILSGRSQRRFRLRKLMWPAILIAVVGLGYVGLQWQNQARAERFFQDGVAAQFATQANLESARNNYLSALELRPRHARTHYYLGHVYAQLQLLDAARADFAMSVTLGRGLDASQIADARKQLAVLSVSNEPAAITRTVATPSQPPQLEAPAAEAPATRAPSAAPGIVAMRPPSPFPSLGGLPHLPPDAEMNARIEPLVTQMFAPDKQARISATTSLIVDTALASDAAPLALKAALSIQRNMPGEAADRATAQSGVINTLVLLRSVSPITLRKHADDVRALIELARPNGSQTAEIADEVAARLKTAVAQRPIAWIQIANEAQRPLAERLARRLREVGYDAPGVENVGDRSPATRSEIRIQGNSDQALARWEAQAMRKLDLGDPKLTVLRKATPKVDTYEIWFDRGLCVTRVVTGCAPLSR